MASTFSLWLLWLLFWVVSFLDCGARVPALDCLSVPPDPCAPCVHIKNIIHVELVRGVFNLGTPGPHRAIELDGHVLPRYMYIRI